MKREKPTDRTPDAAPEDEVLAESGSEATAGDEPTTDAGAPASGDEPSSDEQVRFYVDRLQRMQAEFENFRRRSQQELRDREARTIARIFRSVLTVVDDLRLAARAEEQTAEGISEGLRIILDKVSGVLSEFSIEEIPAEGEPFDPQWHEAMIQQESDDVPPGSVLQELERGYRLGETLIRPSRVIVAKEKEGSPRADV